MILEKGGIKSDNYIYTWRNHSHISDVHTFFLFVCSLFVRTDRQYTEDSRFYRHLLYGATGFCHVVSKSENACDWHGEDSSGCQTTLCGNHLSNYDPLIEWQVFKKWDVAFISKPENFKIPIFGRIIRRCCFMPIDRSDPGKALSTIKTATEILQKGDMAVGVYPEGTRNRQGGLLPFHTGVFRIAQKAHAPIVVMAIHGTENIYRNVLRRRSDVYIDAVDVIPADEVKAMKKNEISDRVRLVLEKDEKGKNYGKEVHFI